MTPRSLTDTHESPVPGASGCRGCAIKGSRRCGGGCRCLKLVKNAESWLSDRRCYLSARDCKVNTHKAVIFLLLLPTQ